MDNIIKYVRNRGTGSPSGQTPYLNLEDSVSVSRADLTSSSQNENYSSTLNNSTDNISQSQSSRNDGMIEFTFNLGRIDFF